MDQLAKSEVKYPYRPNYWFVYIFRSVEISISSLKVSSRDPIFASNCSLANLFRQQLDAWTPIFDSFCVLDENMFIKWPPQLGLAAVK